MYFVIKMNNNKNYMIFALMGLVLFGGLAYVMGQAAGNIITIRENEIDSRTVLTLSLIHISEPTRPY